ncbi:hypothetical protein FG379_000444 [Cryptosporidium bovis]|uniref:uncharacterized protein n=1 Tax=Cryptosporidium bovis TaxID=310047 RepID=UPI00351AAFF8|nr:hypothetical protein FG379_000444 [Cryptosporidium bovis]
MAPTKVNRDKIEFAFRDAAGNGPTIQTSKVGEIVRRMGLAPSEAEIEQFMATVGQQCDLAKFIRFCDSIVHPEDTYDNLVQFFKSYDSKNSGSITSQQLKSLFTNSGEVLSEKEIEMLIREFPSSDGGFNYEQFLKENSPLILHLISIVCMCAAINAILYFARLNLKE